jgi:hypothetical protein
VSNVLNIDVYQGATFKKIIRIKDSAIDPEDPPVARDLTGYVARGQIRKHYSDSNLIAAFVLTIKDQITNTGEIDWLLLPTTIQDHRYKEKMEFVYDVELVSPSGEVERVLQGTANIFPEVTR